MMKDKVCRFCGSELKTSFIDLGMSPLSNSYIKAENLHHKEIYYPLHAFVCSKCFLVQLEEFESPKEIFREYAYFSSFSDSWLKHVQQYTKIMIEKLELNAKSLVIEIASNDGYLLQYFNEKNIQVLGIEPAENVALEAEKKGIQTKIDFFTAALAENLMRKHVEADLLIANNVLAHVPDINDFVSGMKKVLKKQGVITVEFPHLLKLMQENQFDTIYHEHFSYFSLLTAKQVFEQHGLCVFDVEELPTHGGSLRIYVKHIEDATKTITRNVENIIVKEIKAGLNNIETYKAFSMKVKILKRDILEAFINLENQGMQIVGYGAPAKGNTLLNYCGIGKDFLEYTVDRSPYKQGLYLPGTHIPIYSPEKIRETKPDYTVILPWNVKEEVMNQVEFVREWNGKFITLIPEVKVYG